MQVLMPRAVHLGQTGAGGQELGLQFGDRLPQRHRVGVHRPERVIGHARPAMGSGVQPPFLLLVAAAGEHHIADQPDHQHAATDCQDDQQECQHAGQDLGGQDDTEAEYDELGQAAGAMTVGVGAIHHRSPPVASSAQVTAQPQQRHSWHTWMPLDVSVNWAPQLGQ